MGRAFGKFIGGVAQGLAAGIMAEAEQKRQAALLDIERNYRRQDQEYADTLAERRNEREAGRRSQEAIEADKRITARQEAEPVETYDEETGKVRYTPKGQAKGLLSPKSKPDAASSEPLEETYDPKSGQITLTPRSRAAGLLSKANKPGASGDDQIQPADVAGRILDKMARGQALSKEEMAAFEAYQKLDPFRQALARALAGGGAGAPGSPFADDGMGPGGPGPKPPGAEAKPQGAVAPDPEDKADFDAAPEGAAILNDKTGEYFRKQGRWLVPAPELKSRMEQ